MEMTQCFILFLCFAETCSTRTFFYLGLLHTWLLPRLSVRTSDEAGERNLHLATCFVHLTSTVPYDRIREYLTHELYMKVLHKGAARRQCRLWRPKARPVILEPCIFGAATMWREGTIHVLTLW